MLKWKVRKDDDVRAECELQYLVHSREDHFSWSEMRKYREHALPLDTGLGGRVWV